MRIAISSKSGCGNTTVTTLLAERLGYKMINFTFRQLAAERGVEFWDFCRMAENDVRIQALLYTLKNSKKLPSYVIVQHFGKCDSCGSPISDLDSIRRGICQYFFNLPAFALL